MKHFRLSINKLGTLSFHAEDRVALLKLLRRCGIQRKQIIKASEVLTRERRIRI